jgi:hypothetical protein
MPRHVDPQYANMYQQEITMAMHQLNFSNIGVSRREFIGNAIFKHVQKLVGTEKAPKVTGMLLDLPPAELNYTVTHWHLLEDKVMSALELIKEAEQQPDDQQ